MDPAIEIELLIRAKVPILYLVSWEERRVIQTLKAICKSRQRTLHEWSVTDGLVPPLPTTKEGPNPELRVLMEIMEAPDKSVFVLKDFHPFLRDLRSIRLLRDLAHDLRGKAVTVILLSPSLNLPPELEKDINVLEFPLPNKSEIEAKLNDVISAVGSNSEIDTNLSPEDREHLVKAAQGLTLDEVENCLSRSLVEFKRLDVATILQEKRQIIRKSGILEFYPAEMKLSDIGGLDLLKDWLTKRSSALTDKARSFGIPSPKGLLILGVQGCGKSLCAKAISSAWGLPLLKLDVGRIFGSLVGQSEENMRRAIAVAEGVSPCILWADELEKGFGGMAGGSGDSGTGARVLATFLSWMQEKTKPVFIVATANDVTKLPPELMRKGRFDDIFFVDLPGTKEREEIFAIHLKKRKRDPAEFDLKLLSEATVGFSGAEIEQVVIGGLHLAFNDDGLLNTEDMVKEAKNQVPLSRMMEEDIAWLRDWASLRTRPSTSAN